MSVKVEVEFASTSNGVQFYTVKNGETGEYLLTLDRGEKSPVFHGRFRELAAHFDIYAVRSEFGKENVVVKR